MSALSAPAMERKKPGVTCSKAKVEKPSADQPSTFTQELQMERVNKIFGMLRQGKVVQLRELAMELNLSTSHLQHLFKQYAGFPLGRCLVEQRLDIAAQLLRSTKMRIKEIAFTVGYEHPSSFIRAFQRRFTEPPKAYRRNNHSSSLKKLTESNLS